MKLLHPLSVRLHVNLYDFLRWYRRSPWGRDLPTNLPLQLEFACSVLDNDLRGHGKDYGQAEFFAQMVELVADVWDNHDEDDVPETDGQLLFAYSPHFTTQCEEFYARLRASVAPPLARLLPRYELDCIAQLTATGGLFTLHPHDPHASPPAGAARPWLEHFGAEPAITGPAVY